MAIKKGFNNAKGGGGGGGRSTFFTTTRPTFDNVNYVYVLAKSNVDNGTRATFNTGDLVEYINSSGKLDGVFTITAVGSTDLTLSFIASIPPYENGCWILDTTNLTLDSGNYYIGALSDIDNRNNKEIKVGDILLGTDGNTYTLYEINGNEIVVVLAISGGGKQLYQHNMSYAGTGVVNGVINWTIISDREDAYDFASLLQYLLDNGLTTQSKSLQVSGAVYTSSNSKFWVYHGMYANNTNGGTIFVDCMNTAGTPAQDTYTSWTFNDEVITL